MKIISWNICCLPRKLNLYHNPNKNIIKIIDTIFRLNPTIILLQEVFDLKIQDTIVRNLEKNSYYCHVSENLPIISSNGLLTASKKPILNMDLYKFKNNTSVEFFIEKGIQKTKIDGVTIYNTHIQSNSMIGMYSRCRHYRYGQYKETIDFIDSSEPLVFGGDLNEDEVIIYELGERNGKSFARNVHRPLHEPKIIESVVKLYLKKNQN